MLSIGTMVLAASPLAFIEGLGGMEMLLIFVIVLMLFGGDKLPEFARGLGKTMREFKKAASGVEEEFKRAMEEDERKRAATAAATSPNITGGVEQTYPSSYPEDGSGGYGTEGGPTATTTNPAPATGTTAAPASADTAAASPAPEATASAETKPATIPPAPPIKNEDYP